MRSRLNGAVVALPWTTYMAIAIFPIVSAVLTKMANGLGGPFFQRETMFRPSTKTKKTRFTRYTDVRLEKQPSQSRKSVFAAIDTGTLANTDTQPSQETQASLGTALKMESGTRYLSIGAMPQTVVRIGPVTDKKPANREYLPGAGGTQARANYQTEHVFEGQLIGDLFSWWLEKGQVHNQNPVPSNPQAKLTCSLTRQFITANNPRWRLGGRRASFLKLMLAELGSETHLDRLTLFMGRPNGKKGSMFTGNQPTSLTKYLSMTQDEQLQSVKEMGMIFTYLNTQEVWDKFCGTYEAIYDLLGDFDTWYSQNGQGVAIPNLQDEWKEYIRVSLDSLVRRSRATFDYMLAHRRQGGLLGIDPPFTFHWLNNRFTNRQLIRLSLTCRNMDPSTA